MDGDLEAPSISGTDNHHRWVCVGLRGTGHRRSNPYDSRIARMYTNDIEAGGIAAMKADRPRLLVVRRAAC